ncbi:short-chain dehydrogenase [Pterulicium gracile]|uniref:Short-chain dehydrogenase n=1 Tax=Pterulicium gracile TaxID=1884261 RepID=A0A5C3Q281_9AGAR|nr:short-chain dehydrogenase [Pterula gracilis]
MKFSWWNVLLTQFSRPLPVASEDLSEQTVVILGANTGLGFEAAKHFARMEPGRLILACRSQSKGAEALDTLRRETGYERGEVWMIDLADFASIGRFADRFNQEEARLDILVANAASGLATYELTKDGYETTLQVNHLSTTLVSLLLLPKMVATSKLNSKTSARKPRLVVVSSGLHHMYQFDARALAKRSVLSYVSGSEHCTPANLAGGRVYSMSKLLNVFFVRSLASRLSTEGPSVIATIVEPGYCYSSLRRHWTGLQSLVDSLTQFLLARSTEVGSRQLVCGALSFEDEEVHGQYIDTSATSEVADYVLENRDLEDRIWDETLEILIKAEPRVAEVVKQILGRAHHAKT